MSLEGNCTIAIDDLGVSKKYFCQNECLNDLNSNIDGFELSNHSFVTHYLDKNQTYKGYKFITLVRKF